MAVYKILALNPGGTSTKLGYFENDKAVFTKNVAHDENELRAFSDPNDQLDYRFAAISEELEKSGIDAAGCDAYVGRGGGLGACVGGSFLVNEDMLEYFRTAPVRHPASLGAQISWLLAKQYDGVALTISAEDADELCDSARFTGITDVYRESHCHALNMKEIGHRYAQSKGKRYQDLKLVICHIGTGSSVAAHKNGMIMDCSNNMGGEGPMCGTRCGAVAVRSIVKLAFSGKYTEAELIALTDRNGGWVSLLGTSEGLEIKRRIAEGDEFARLVYEATIYQHAKYIGAHAAVLGEKADAIIVTGGVAKDEYLTGELKKYVDHMAHDYVVMAGEFELEALAQSALRHLTGDEEAKVYTGEPYWKGFAIVT